MGLAGVKLFQRALNWHSKRSGGREWTIMPSAWHDRRQQQEARRKPEREQTAAELVAQAEQVKRHAQQLDREQLKTIERQLAENFRDFGRRVVAGEVPIDDDLLDVSTLKKIDIEAALASEVDAREIAQSTARAPERGTQ